MHSVFSYLIMSVNQSLDFFNSVDDEHVNQILAGSIQPVIKWL